jgi:hypothetical protein
MQEVALAGGFHALGDHRQAQALPSAITVRAIAASLASVSTSRTKDWSIFSCASGRRFR